MSNLNEQQFEKFTRIVTEDGVGLVNIIDEDGNSPLLLLSRNNQSTHTFKCMQVMLIKTHNRGAQKGVLLDINYQDPKGFNALHYVCMRYYGNDLHEIIKLLVSYGIDINRTDRELCCNALQLLLKHQHPDRDLFNMIQYLVKAGINLEHKNKQGETAVDYLRQFYKLDNFEDLNGFLNNERQTQFTAINRKSNSDKLLLDSDGTNQTRNRISSGWSTNREDAAIGTGEIKYEQEAEIKDENQQLEEKAITVEITAPEGPTATVYLAAPTGKKLAIAVRDESLQGWNKPQGYFTLFKDIETGYGVFKGVVPIHLNSFTAFRFVQLDSCDQIVRYEGDADRDDHFDELLPDGMYFFIFKESKGGLLNQGKQFLAEKFRFRAKTEKKILTEFLKISFKHAIDQISSWDSAIDIIKDCQEKLERLKCAELTGCIKKFVSDRLDPSGVQPVNLDRLLLLIIGVHDTIKNNFPKDLKHFLESYAEPFSLYLYQFGNLKRNGDLILQVFESIGVQGGPGYSWIPFCFHFPDCNNIRENPKLVGDALIKNMSAMPEALLSKETVTSRVINFLTLHNDLDDINDRLLPIICQKAEYQNLVDRHLLRSVLDQAKTTDESARVLRSRFLKRISDGPVTDEESLKAFFSDLFNKKPSDVIKLASLSREWPESVLNFVKPIVETMINKKVQMPTLQLNNDDYQYFALLDSSMLVDFPEALRKIDEICMKMSKDHVRFGYFQNVPSLKLILRCLAEMDYPVLFLEQSSFEDLQKIVNTLPQNFLQNLDKTLKNPALFDRNLNIHKNGETKNMARRVEKHSDMITEILEKVRRRSIPLVEIKRLQDPKVMDYLKYLGIENKIMLDIQRQVEELKQRHKLYGDLYTQFSWYYL